MALDKELKEATLKATTTLDKENGKPVVKKLAKEKADKAEAKVKAAFDAADPRIMHVRLTFVDELLGTCANNKDIYGDYIASKNPDGITMAEEIENIGEEEVKEKGKTIFAKNKQGKPILYSYQIKGFFKSACKAMKAVNGTRSHEVKAYKGKIDQLIFVWPNAEDKTSREILIHTNTISECQRPLRADTAQGPRVAIAYSESIPAGAYVEFDIEVLDPKDMDLVREWLNYGIYNGLCQWRNAGKGAFNWQELQRKPDNGGSVFK